ncbi:MAG: metal ABC transporter ATP-binding protein [Cyanobacteria bacterium P01_H01_bin.152]
MNDPVLVVQGLTVYRGTHLAAQDISFTVPAGTDTAIIGPNGAGKSTLIQAVLGILPHQAGQIMALGHALSDRGYLPPAVRQQIAYLPQNFLLDRRIPITVSELVGLGWDRVGLQLPWVGSRARRQAVRAALTKVEAWHLRDQLVSSLSGGETKRVLLAYCLVRPRALLILDEAPAGLDVRGESEFYQLLHQLKQEQGWAILQVSHDLDMVRRSCDRVLCINRQLLCEGTPDHALAPEQLSLAYGPDLVRYQHNC